MTGIPLLFRVPKNSYKSWKQKNTREKCQSQPARLSAGILYFPFHYKAPTFYSQTDPFLPYIFM